MQDGALFGALLVERCHQCDWVSPVYKSPASPEKAAEMAALLRAHMVSHDDPLAKQESQAK
jgi:hypothetical protein